MFDARSAKSLAPGAHLTISEAPGLRLEATASTRAWCYRYKSPLDGRMRQIKIGTWPAMGYQAAWVEWEKLRQARERGECPASAKRAASTEEKTQAKAAKVLAKEGPYTVARLCADYVSTLKRQRQQKSWAEVQRLFDTMLGDLADRLPETINRRDAFDLINSHADTPVQARSLRGELGGAWEHGHDSGRLGDEVPNWWRQIMRGKLRTKGKMIAGERAPLKRVLSAQELGQLLYELPALPRNTQDALTLYLWTGCRGAEIVAMRADEVQSEGEVLWWTIPKAKTKNARIESATDHRVPLIGRAAEVVRRRMAAAPEGFLFPSTGASGHIAQKAVGLAVWMAMPYCKIKPDYQRARLSVTHWAPHDLRRSVRTLLASLGCPSDVGEVLLGHILPGVEGVYNLHKYDAERVHWLRRLDAKLQELADEAKKKPAI